MDASLLEIVKMPKLAMSSASLVVPASTGADTHAAAWLKRSVVSWISVALVGQAIFATYVALFYGRSALAGAPERWNRVMPRGWVSGQTFDNAILAFHLAASLLLLIAGAMQLIPALRRRWPAVHRWTGRSYLVAAMLLSLGGLWLVWGRGGVVGDLSQHVAISLNAALIVACAVMAWRMARDRRFDAHRRWALRVFVAASGVWFFRVGLMAWLGLWRAPVGFDPKSFSGPFLTALAWGVYVIVPLLTLEAVLRAQRSRDASLQWSAAMGMALLTLLTVLGIVMATLGMWLPRMR